MRILKFGGSSMANAERFKNVRNIVQAKIAAQEKLCLVVSATYGSTNELEEMGRLASKGDASYKNLLRDFRIKHHAIIDDLFSGAANEELKLALGHALEDLRNILKGILLLLEATPRTKDYLLSFGERISAYLLSNYFQHSGLNANYLDARKVIYTDKNFGAAKVNQEKTYAEIKAHFAAHTDSIQVVTGFISTAKGGLTSTLGRGGSDYTASLLGAALDADAIEIWTDVDGVLTADPRRVKQTLCIPKMTYEEAVEMSHFGARVIYPPTIQPAMEKSIPIYIKNSFAPDAPGTLISHESASDKKAVKGISSISAVSLLTLSGSGLFGVPGIAARLFDALAQASINVILITQGSSEHSISFAVDPKYARQSKRVIEDTFTYEIDLKNINPVKIEQDLSVVAIIGENMRYVPGIAGRMLTALGNNGINAVAIAQGSSELNISVVINQSDEAKAIQALHENFFLSETKVINLFMVGVGLIGSTLLRQISDQSNFLKSERSLEIRLIGLANSKKMCFDANGLDIDDWQKPLTESNTASDIAAFSKTMIEMNLPNSVFVDNTADKKIPNSYASILDASIAISTPNKIASSSDFKAFEDLRRIAQRRNVLFGYETNVGAGLPVISTLRNLIDSGDDILKIEAVLSGSLSFIFNNYGADTNFSEVVKEAQEKGYTEPDPREDLSGMDVCRKIIILGRVAGLELEKRDVAVDQILSDALFDIPSVESFFEALPTENDRLAQLRDAALQEGKRLRFIAKLQEEAASISLTAVDSSSPFYNLSGSDNMIIFTTARYKETPLVIQGPGAGAEVTAAGVFSEIILTAKKF